jgi:integrase
MPPCHYRRPVWLERDSVGEHDDRGAHRLRVLSIRAGEDSQQTMATRNGFDGEQFVASWSPVADGYAQALLDAASGDWVTMVLLGYFTGARLGDCAALTWQQVDLEAGLIRYVPQKTRRTGRCLVIPLHPDLLNHLRRVAGENVGYICPSLANRPVGGHRGLSNGFKCLMREAGIDPQTSPGDGVRRFSRLMFHSLRYAFNTLLANRGVPQDVRMELVGHSSATVNALYTHHDMAHLRGAIELLPGLAEQSNIVELCSDVLPVSGALP